MIPDAFNAASDATNELLDVLLVVLDRDAGMTLLAKLARLDGMPVAIARRLRVALSLCLDAVPARGLTSEQIHVIATARAVYIAMRGEQTADEVRP